MRHCRFSRLASSHSCTSCTRCSGAFQKNVVHCIWQCPVFQTVWQWPQHPAQQVRSSIVNTPSCRFALSLSLFVLNRFSLLILPLNILAVLWSTVRPIINLSIKKDSFCHIIEGTSSSEGVVRKSSRARFSVYS